MLAIAIPAFFLVAIGIWVYLDIITGSYDD